MTTPKGTQYDRSQAMPDLSHIHGAIMNKVQFSSTEAAQPGKEDKCPSH